MDNLPQRRRLGHSVPVWVRRSPTFFVTACTSPRGQNQLCQPEIASGLLQSAEYYHRIRRWWLKLILLMPDHLHALVHMPPGENLAEVMRMWRGYQAKRHGLKWQAGFFDHRLRSGESEQQKADYILANPVRAGLVGRAEDWPYVWPSNAIELSARRDDSPYQ